MSQDNPVTTYFDRVAGQWDSLREGYFTEEVRQAAIAHAYLRPEMVAADIGAGTGFMTAGIAGLVSHIHVIDGSAAMLEVARKNLTDYTNLEFHQADGSALPLPNGSVDVIFANMLLHHCPDPLATIQEMARILKPGGRLVITDLDAHTHTWLKDEMADLWQGFERGQLRAWLQQAGLVNVIVTGTGQMCCAESQCESTAGDERHARINVFVATGTLRLVMRDSVQAAYSAAALSGSCCGGSADAASSSCCSPSISVPVQDSVYEHAYSLEERTAIPTEAAQISLGCGNPVALAGLQPGEVVLDIGSGGGIDAFLAARRVGPSGRVIGVDMTPAMLQRARRAAKQAGITNVMFRHGQAEKLPVEDASVDVILSNCVINLCEDKDLVFREAFAALKPGGRLEVSDIVTDGTFSAQARQDASEWAGCVSGALPAQEYIELMAQAGFTDITTRQSTQMGTLDGVRIFSAIISARKPVTESSCGCQ